MVHQTTPTPQTIVEADQKIAEKFPLPQILPPRNIWLPKTALSFVEEKKTERMDEMRRDLPLDSSLVATAQPHSLVAPPTVSPFLPPPPGLPPGPPLLWFQQVQLGGDKAEAQTQTSARGSGTLEFGFLTDSFLRSECVQNQKRVTLREAIQTNALQLISEDKSKAVSFSDSYPFPKELERLKELLQKTWEKGKHKGKKYAELITSERAYLKKYVFPQAKKSKNAQFQNVKDFVSAIGIDIVF